MTSPIVSVCLPVYNGENYLAPAIKSVLAQTFRDFELLIVDDCSTDGTADIAKEFASQDARIKVLRNQKNFGLFGNYNLSMQEAAGEFIKLFAHDDLFEPVILERMLEVFKREPKVALVAVSRGWVDSAGQMIAAADASELKTMKPFDSDTYLESEEAICGTLRKMANWLGEPCSQMFRRQHVGAGFDTRFKQVGDLDFSYRLLEHGDYYFIADQLCYFRKHAEANSQRFSRSMDALLDWFVLGSKHKNYLAKAGLTEDEYCLLLTKRLAGIFAKAMTKATTSVMNGIDRESYESIVDSFLGKDKSLLSYFGGDGVTSRQSPDEYRAFAVLSMLALADCYRQRDEVQDQKMRFDGVIESLKLEIASTKKLLGSEVQELQDALTEMGSSQSWKLTAPLRNWKQHLRL